MAGPLAPPRMRPGQEIAQYAEDLHRWMVANWPRPENRVAPVAGFRPVQVALRQKLNRDPYTVTLSPGYIILRGALVSVPEQTVTLADGVNFTWLQFAIAPAVTPSPLFQVGAEMPSGTSLDLVNYGYYPMGQWDYDSGIPTAELVTLYHPGGNIGYPVS